MRNFLTDNVEELLSEDPKDEIYWEDAIDRSGMKEVDKDICRQLIRNGPDTGSTLRALERYDSRSLRPRDSRSSKLSALVGRDSDLLNTRRWPRRQHSDDNLYGRNSYKRSRSASNFRRSGRLEEQVENVLDAAENLQEESRALARIVRRNG